MRVRKSNSAKFNLNIKLPGSEQEYTLTGNDIAEFTVRRDFNSTVVLRKLLTVDNYENGQLVLEIYPEDTFNMEAGSYIYDVALRIDYNTAQEQFITVISPRTFTLSDVVTNFDSQIGIELKSPPTWDDILNKPEEFPPMPHEHPELVTTRALADLEANISNLEVFLGYTDADIYGIEADFENSRFIRLSGAAGRTAGADFDGINAFGGRRRCTVLDNGTITSYFGDADYIEDGSTGQVMVYQPKFYYRMVPLKLEPIAGSIGFHIRKARYYVSDTPKAGFKLHPAFIKDGTERPYVLIGAYEGCLQRGNVFNLTDEQNGNFTPGSGDKLSSVANAKPASGTTQQLTRPNVRNIAANRGTGWSQTYTAIVSLTQMLFIIEYCTFNTQNAIGMGVVSKSSGTDNNSENTGQTAHLGNTSGMAQGTNGLVSVSYRGEENPWGNIWSFVDGMNVWGDGTLRGGVPYIADNGFAESVNTGNYQSVGFTMLNAGAYISAIGYGNSDFDWVFLGTEGLGNSNLPIGDFNWAVSNMNGFCIAILGAGWDNSATAGFFYWAVGNPVSRSNRNLGGRLVYVPNAVQGGA